MAIISKSLAIRRPPNFGGPAASLRLLFFLPFLLLSVVAEDGQEKAKNGTKLSEENEPKSAEERRTQFFARVHNVPMGTEHGMELYQHWIDQALSSLMAAMAQKKPAQDEFGQCSGAASSVPRHARCVSRLLRGSFTGAKIYEKTKAKMLRFDRYRMAKRTQMRKAMIKVPERRILIRARSMEEDQNWVGNFHLALKQSTMTTTTAVGLTRSTGLTTPTMGLNSSIMRLNQFNKTGFTRLGRHLLHSYTGHRRERRHSGIVKKNHYELLSPVQYKLSPLGSMAKLLMGEVLKAKGKHAQDIVPWQKTIQRLQGSAHKRKEIRQRMEAELESEQKPDLDQFKFRGLKSRGLIGDDLHTLAEDPTRLRSFLDKRKRNGKDQKRNGPIERVLALLRQGISLGYRMAGGQNGTELEERTLRTLSPRFLSVTPEEPDPEGNRTLDMLSPSLFSLHSEGTGLEQLTSLPSLIHGFSTKDQQAWMDLIIEASGVVEQAEKIEQELGQGEVNTVLRKAMAERGNPGDRAKYEREIRAKDGTPLYFTKQNITDAFGSFEERKCDVFERLELSLSKDQLHEMNATGYAMLSRDQLHLLYGPESPYNNSKALHRFTRMNESEMHAGLEQDVHALAELDSFRVRQRDIVLSPILFTSFIGQFSLLNPVVLSPILFAPLVLSPNVLGPTILSPWMFVPVILSPRALAPTVLSPLALNPVILSPFVLHPVILSPGVLNPIVLNPFVLSPFILSPQAFTPLILSPTVLSPYILNPGVGNPLVLSPYVLGPIILSPQFFSALILSPYALSPVIYSPLTAVTVILSPSWLS